MSSDKTPQPELTDAFTGELFTPHSRNHYEVNDGKPVAPAVEFNRPTIRQRIENLINRGVDPLAHYVGTEGIEMDVPDDGEAPLTQSEQNYLDTIAAELAEQAPLPDDGLPRPQEPVQAVSPPAAPWGAPGAQSAPVGVPQGNQGTSPAVVPPNPVPTR